MKLKDDERGKGENSKRNAPVKPGGMLKGGDAPPREERGKE